MKKLMLLGGSRYLLPVIETAHKLGMYVITCDYLPDNIAHKYSDQYCNVSIVDKEAVLDVAKELCIDGIMSFACDPGVVTAAYVAEKMGIPSCGPYESVCILQNKGRFRAFLAEHGFQVPCAKSYSDPAAALQDIEAFHWPVIVKPTDSAGSKGVIRVDDPNALESGIQYALDYSIGKEFIIEEFIEKRGCSSDSDCFSVNGELKFVSFSSQRFDESAANPYTPAAYSWPSSLSAEHEEELAAELQRLLKLLNMNTALYNVETREGMDGKAYLMEVSPRGGGNRLSEMLEYATGVKLIENAVRAAVGMPLVELAQRTYDGIWAEVILHGDADGIFEELQISEELSPCVVERDLWVKPGDQIYAFSAANASIGTLVLKFCDENQMQNILGDINCHISICLKK